MAKLQSPVFNIIRGSVIGATYLSNQFHQIVCRGRTAPVQPYTNPQNIMRACFSQASTAWRDGCSAPLRELWHDYAQTCQYTGPLGPYKIPGRQLFIACVSLAAYIKARYVPGLQVRWECPTTPGFYTLDGILLGPPSAPGTGFSVTINNYGLRNVQALIEVSVPFNQTRYRFKGPWEDDMTTNLAISANSSGNKNFTTPLADKAYFVRVRCVTVHPSGDVGHAITAEFFGRVISAVTGP